MCLKRFSKNFERSFVRGPLVRLVDAQKAQPNIEKHGGRMVMLITVLVKSITFEKSENSENK